MSFRRLQNSLSKTRLIRKIATPTSAIGGVVQLCIAEQTEYD